MAKIRPGLQGGLSPIQGGEDMRIHHTLMATVGLAAMLAGYANAQEAATVAFLMPDQASTRYEEHDYPGF